jgi:predicted lipoprotein with Yx(FWY)xxD motif
MNQTMMMRRPAPAAAATRALTWRVGLAALALVASAAAGCTSTAANGHQPARPSATSAPLPTPQVLPANAATLTMASSAYGHILETGTGKAVYYFTRDSNSASRCAGTCAARWRPLILTGRLHLAAGVSTALVGHIARPGGGLQLSYAGHPLYTYSGDTAPGQINGQAIHAFGGMWLVVPANGKPNVHLGPTSTAPSGGTGI